MGSSGKIKPIPDIILFDGVCNLCSGSVQFILKREKKEAFQFASLQSGYGQKQLEKLNLNKSNLHSIILIRPNSHQDQFFQRSEAALEIARKLGAGWPLLYGFKVIPRFIRDGIYNWIANNRYQFFGRKNTCWIPAPELKDRFIE